MFVGAKELLSELLWVSRQRLILFEPSYELSADEQREHVEHHGYMRGLPDIVSSLGHDAVQVELLGNTALGTVIGG